jgi:hypothetical protein
MSQLPLCHTCLHCASGKYGRNDNILEGLKKKFEVYQELVLNFLFLKPAHMHNKAEGFKSHLVAVYEVSNMNL